MQRNLSTGFEDSYRRHLVVEQRKAVLETIARELNPGTTLGDIVDAAQELGWGDAMGELSLGEFAEALLGGEAVAAPAAVVADESDDESELEGEEEEEEDEGELFAEEPEDDDDLSETEEDVAPPPVAKASRGKAKVGAKKAAKVAKEAKETKATKSAKPAKGGRVVPTQTALPIIPPAPAGKKGAAAAAKKQLSKKAAKKAAMYVAAMQDDSDAMNLDQAAKLLVPIVRKLKEATMQDLEEQTGMGRRKLRFHIGQLVKHGRLKRHGMGRGTCYTVK